MCPFVVADNVKQKRYVTPELWERRGLMRSQGGGPRSDRFTSPLTIPSAVNHHLRRERALLD